MLGLQFYEPMSPKQLAKKQI